MGDYTGIVTDVTLYRLTARERAWLEWVCARPGDDVEDDARRAFWDAHRESEPPAPEHPFFGLWRRTFIFRGGSAYFSEFDDVRPSFAEVGPGVVRVTASASLKNYRDEIQTWMDWVETRVVVGRVEWRFEYDDEWSIKMWKRTGPLEGASRM